MGKEARQVSQLALLESVHALVLRGEQLAELLLVHLKQMTEALSYVSIERQVSTILHTALDNHGAKFDFLPSSYLKFEQFVAALLELHRRHDDEVDCLAQLDQVLLRVVLDFLYKQRFLRLNTLAIEEDIFAYLGIVDSLS